jgi:hypothetical protein
MSRPTYLTTWLRASLGALLVLGLLLYGVGLSTAEDKKDDVKKEEPKKDEPKKEEPKKEEPKKEEPKKEEPKKLTPEEFEKQAAEIRKKFEKAQREAMQHAEELEKQLQKARAEAEQQVQKAQEAMRKEMDELRRQLQPVVLSRRPWVPTPGAAGRHHRSAQRGAGGPTWPRERQGTADHGGRPRHPGRQGGVETV